MHAVLTGDIVNSTKLDIPVEKRLFKILHQVLNPYPFEFYRGDSFQVYIKDPGKSLNTALLCRTAAISITRTRPVLSDIRISIGIGSVKTPVKKLGSAKGEAFILSGRSFDEIQKTDIRLSIVTNDNIVNAGLQVIADYINSIYKEMTAKQAEVIFELLSGQTQQKAVSHLKKSKSTIHQLVAGGRWPEIQKLMQQFENLINQLT